MSTSDILIFIIVATVIQVHGQECTWTWLQPSGSGATLTRSVGSVATFIASVNDVLPNEAYLTWKTGIADLSIEEYSLASDTFTALIVDLRGVTTSFEDRASGVGHVYTMNFPTVAGVTSANNNTEYTVTSQGCIGGATSPSVRLSVAYCDLNAFSSEANAVVTTDCGYNCTRQFTCISDPTLSFEATCQVDATWSESTPISQDRCKFCRAADFLPSAIEAISVQVGMNQEKKFNCVCSIGVESFVAKCQTGLLWNYTMSTIPCHAACNISEVTFANPVNDTFLCGVQSFLCDSQRVCERTTFDLECAANGTWISIDEHQCSKDMCSHAAVSEICGQNCQYQNTSGISCGDRLLYDCVNGASDTTSLPVICNASGSFNYSGPLCNFTDTDSCQETCNLTSIQTICGQNCYHGSLSTVGCNETLSYNCTGGAVFVTSQPIKCVGTNNFNYSTQLCQLPVTSTPETSTCTGGCDSSTVQSICDDFCEHGAIDSLECNETLSYNCTGGAEPATSHPIKCIDANTLSYSSPLCKANTTQGATSCSEMCNISSIQAICNGSCSHEGINVVACNDTLDYTCEGCSGLCSLPAVHCIGENVFNYTRPLCRCEGENCGDSRVMKNSSIVLAGVATFEIILVWAYLGYLCKSGCRDFETGKLLVIIMGILTAVALADWILIIFSETEDNISTTATLTIGSILTLSATIILIATIYSHCKYFSKNKIGTAEGGNGGNVTMKATVGDEQPENI